MTNNTDKCVAVLTRCGHFSRVGALALVPTLSGEEVAELVKLHEGLAKTDQTPAAEASPAEKQQFLQAAEALLREVGERFRQLLNVIADRQAKGAETSQVPTPKSQVDRKFAEAKAGQAQSDGTPPIASEA